jgi:hypothetical protein
VAEGVTSREHLVFMDCRSISALHPTQVYADGHEFARATEILCLCMRFKGSFSMKERSAPGAFHPEMLGNHRGLQTGNGQIESSYPLRGITEEFQCREDRCMAIQAKALT